MLNFLKTFGSIALSSVLAFSGTSAGIATAAPTAGVAGAVDATMEPQVALVWLVWQDNFYFEATCINASFTILSTHGYIRGYKCRQNPYGSFNSGRWSLWVYVPDSVHPPK
ncbi:hypothetical protein [Arthrobacter sp. efr-133-TYG-118]|uniref:hypothetical protein n=1 Tax=Arthrobacter sp. efr-133-TYG-118 TaxID=3040279 RepID=UPI0025507B4D|nr:hypothetical protein [Arthrobacter sp. efr-133-TYG-118]